MLSITHSDTQANQKFNEMSTHTGPDGHLKTYKDKSPASAGRLFTTSTTWEALFQYKKNNEIQEKVKKKESGAKRKAAALWPYW